ncbi:thymidine kinase [Myceligenerans halotolerans]
MAELVFFTGTMDSGKSTLALQTDHNYTARGRRGLIFTRGDRAGVARLSSRLGLEVDAREVLDGTDLWAEVHAERHAGRAVDHVVCDEAQFYSPRQVEQLARLVDETEIDVFAFGITTDFRTRLFPGSARLFELADRIEVLQVQSLCWCGARATHNARTVDGVMVTEGDQVVIGDTAEDGDGGTAGGGDDDGSGAVATGAAAVAYEVLCRRHHMRRMTASTARRHSMAGESFWA